MKDFTVWISGEEWAPGEWDPANDATDVLVTLVDGTRMVLVEDTSRPTTEAVIRDLLSTGELQSAFSPVVAESDDSAA